jgi:hypothetical protein
MKDPDTGYKYEGHIVKEHEDDEEVDLVEVIKNYLQDFKDGKLK